jgi:hypothetical protein
VSYPYATGPPTVAAVPVRFNRVAVALTRGPVTLTWNERESICWLLRKRRDVDEAAEIRASFDAVGAFLPVELSYRQRIELLIVLEEFMHDREPESIAPGLYELRNALWEELHDPVKRQAAE